MKFLNDFFSNLFPNISQEAIDVVVSNAVVKEYKKGDVIVNKDVLVDSFYLLESGVVRSYIVGKKESIHTKGFYTVGSVFCPSTSLVAKTINMEVYDCLEPTKVFEFSWSKFKKQTVKYVDLATAYIGFLEGFVIARELRIDNLIALDATERYQNLRKTFPQIENLVAQYHIASYLNITPTQLSRIRKKIYSK